VRGVLSPYHLEENVTQRYAVVAALVLAATACQDATSPRPIASPPAEVNRAQSSAGNDYIIVFRSDEADPPGLANALVKAHGGQLKYVYGSAIKGFAVTDLPDAAVEALQRNPRIELVERDGIMTVDATQTPTPSWGIDRIDAAAGLDLSYTYANTASNVTAYIIDTGINLGISDLSGRILSGADFVDGGTPDDCHGHGTHVAGTVAGTAYGVAKEAKVVAVRVLNCQGSGSSSGVIAGIDWVIQNAVKPAVANMSLGGGLDAALNTAVANAVASGVTFAVAAGNSNANACNYSPSSAPSAITVGATTSTDAKASYSNYGNCVDIQAPGSSITSDWIGSATATNTISGTSMASPHVAGAAALVLGANPAFTPQQVRDALVNNATGGVVTGLASGPNKLLYVGFLAGGPIDPPPPNDPPPSVVASFTKTCNGFTCTFTSTSTGTITSTSWHFNDGKPDATGGQVSRTFAPRNNYTVTLTVNGSISTSGTVTCNPRKCQ
jgi:subtilisin family serine protease